MRLALIFNPFKHKVHEENLRIVQKFFGLFPPLSLAWVAAIAERAGHEVIIIDARTLRLTKEEVLDRLKEFKPDIMGFMMTTYIFRETLEWIKYLKQHLKIPVVIGGYNLRVYPRESVTPEEIDFGVVEQALDTIPQLFSELEGYRRFKDVVGLVYKEDSKIKVNPPEPVDFEAFPNPARHLLPNGLYAEFPTERKNFTVLVTSLGCPKRCTFCEAGGNPHSPRSPSKVVSEIEECYYKYNIREIDIFDYEFPLNKKRTLAICNILQEKKLDITWACRSRIDSVDEELLREMKKAGCRRIYYGIESGVQEILDRVNKGITLNQIRETVRYTKELGIMALGFFLIGAPGETKETIKKTLKFAKELKLNYVQFSKCTAKPMTGLWRKLVRDTGVDYWREYILGNVEEQQLPRPWTRLTNDEIDIITKRAYISYHSGPQFLLNSMLRVKSSAELKRKLFAYLNMVFSQENKSKMDPNFVAYNPNFKRKLK